MQSRALLFKDLEQKLSFLQQNFKHYCDLKKQLDHIDAEMLSLGEQLERKEEVSAETIKIKERIGKLQATRSITTDALDKHIKNAIAEQKNNDSIDEKLTPIRLPELLFAIDAIIEKINRNQTPLEKLKLKLAVAKSALAKKSPENVDHKLYADYIANKRALQLIRKKLPTIKDAYQYTESVKTEQNLIAEFNNLLQSTTPEERALFDEIHTLKVRILNQQPKTPEYNLNKNKLSALMNSSNNHNKDYYIAKNELKFLKRELLNISITAASAETIEKIYQLEKTIAFHRSSDSYIEKLENEMVIITDEMRKLELLKIKEDENEKIARIKERTYERTENFVNPLFQLFINIYNIGKNLLPRLQDRTYQILSSVLLGIGKALNFLSIYHLYVDTRIPQRKTKMANALFNFAASITNIVTVAIKSNPFASGIVALTSLVLGLFKDSYCTHKARESVWNEKAKRLSHEEVHQKISGKSAETQTDEEKIQAITLPFQLQYHDEKLKNLREERFKNKRAVIFTTINTACSLFILAGTLAAATTLFPPLAVTLLADLAVTAASWLTASTIFDLADQFLFDTYFTKKIAGHILQPAKQGIKKSIHHLSTIAKVSLDLSRKGGKSIDFNSKKKPEPEQKQSPTNTSAGSSPHLSKLSLAPSSPSTSPKI